MDAIHTVFQNVLEREKLPKPDHPLRYLIRSVRNALFDEYHRTSKQGNGANTPDDMPFSLELSVEELLVDEEDQKAIALKIEKMLNDLSPRQREIVYLRYICEYSYQEISNIINISVPSCRNLVLRALKELRKNNSYFFYIAIALLSYKK